MLYSESWEIFNSVLIMFLIKDLSTNIITLWWPHNASCCSDWSAVMEWECKSIDTVGNQRSFAQLKCSYMFCFKGQDPAGLTRFSVIWLVSRRAVARFCCEFWSRLAMHHWLSIDISTYPLELKVRELLDAGKPRVNPEQLLYVVFICAFPFTY